MKKLIGVIVLVLVIGAGIGFKLYSDRVKNPGVSSVEAPEPVKPQQFSVIAASGYSMPTVRLDGESVPVLKIPLDTWGGYAGLFAANGGTAPSRDSVFYRKGKFAVEIVSAENAKAQLDGFASGQYPVIWSSMDSLPMLYDALRKDRRVIPQVIGLFDWSFGDGIVVRNGIKTAADLRGKKILTSGNTPYNFFLLWLLGQSEIQPSEVKMVYLGDGEKAFKAFRADPGIDAWVTWEPFLSRSTDPSSASFVKDSRVLISSRDANQLIADVYIARNDFVKEYPAVAEAFVESLLEGERMIRENPEPAFAAMAAFYKLPGGAADARAMLDDVHLANLAETRMFFSPENPVNAGKIFYMAEEYYRGTGSLPADASYEPEVVVNPKFVEAVASKGLFKDDTNRIANSFNKQASFDITDLEGQKVILAEDVEIFFDAQRIDFDMDDTRSEIRKNAVLLEKVSEQMHILGTTAVKLIGHLDTSKVAEYRAKGRQAFIEASSQAKLISKQRAEFVKKVLVERFGCDPARLFTEGHGWDQPVDEADPARNRRVEVKFLSFE